MPGESAECEFTRQELELHFLAAADLNGEARGAYLDEACRNAPESRSQILQMLRHETEAEETIARIVCDSAADVIASRNIQKRFGPYRIVSELGRGGMGSVYLAERDDAEFSRKVAIKLIAQGSAQRP